MSDHDREWLTMAQAADRLGVSPPTLRRWADQGRIGVARTLGGHRRIPISELPRIAPVEVPPPHREETSPLEPRRRERDEDPVRGRADVLDPDAEALRIDRDRIAAERDRLAAEVSRLDREVAFLRRQVEEGTRAQAELRRVVLHLTGAGEDPEDGEAARPGS